MLTMNKVGFFPYTPATQMLQGLAVSIDMLHEEGLDNVFARHARLAEATRRAVRAWGLEILCRDPKYYSPTITAVLLPDGHDADAFRGLALETFNISYGASFGPYAKKYFRIGHLGDINDGWMMGVLATTEMALSLAGIPHKKGGVQAAMDYIVSAQTPRGARGGGVIGLYTARRRSCISPLMALKSRLETLVTVFGGSGFLGRHVVRALANRGYRIRVAVRRPELCGFLRPMGRVGQINTVQANLRYPQSIAVALRDADIAVNLVGILFERGAQRFDAVQAVGSRSGGACGKIRRRPSRPRLCNRR